MEDLWWVRDKVQAIRGNFDLVRTAYLRTAPLCRRLCIMLKFSLMYKGRPMPVSTTRC